MKRLILFLCSVAAALSCLAQASSETERKVSNVATFAKLYGYVRYFYPGDEAAKMNYPKLAQYAIPKVERAGNKTELKDVLDSIFGPIAPGMDLYEDEHPVAFDSKKLWPEKDKNKNLKTISWQHLGYGFTDSRLYTENRTNRVVNKNNETFGNLLASFDGEKYRGRHVRVIAAVKVDAVYGSGSGHLWLRVDRPDHKPGFFANMAHRPITINDWAYYSVEGDVNEDADRVVFGCFLEGSGRLWVDNFHFQVLDDQKEWKDIDSLDHDFEGPITGELPGNWNSNNQYYNAYVTDEKAYTGRHSVCIDVRNQLFNAKTQFGDFVKKSIGSGLSINLPLAVMGDDDHTYPLPDKKRYYAVTRAVENETPRRFDASVKTDQLATAISFWNIFQHFYPYFNEVPVDWEGALKSLIRETYEDKTPEDMLHTLQKYQALLHDGHGKIILNNTKRHPQPLPVSMEWIENQLVITNVYDKTLPLKPGDEVLSINGTESHKYLDSVLVYVSAATEGNRRWKAVNRVVFCDTDKVMRLICTDSSGKNINISMQGSYRWADPKGPVDRVNDDTFRVFRDNICYVNLNNISTRGYGYYMPDLRQAKAIIYDLRGYPYKITPGFICNLLSVRDTDDKWMQVPEIIYPDHDFRNFKKYNWLLEPREPHLNAKIYILTDSRAISAAESYLSYFEGYKLGTIIGEATAGTNGNVNPINISNLVTITWTGMYVQKHDGSRHHGVGIKPDIVVHPTIKGIREGRDEVLEKALELARKQ